MDEQALCTRLLPSINRLLGVTMQLTEIIQIVENRQATLSNGRAQAVAIGDLKAVYELDAQIEETRLTLDQLKASNG